MKSKKLEIGSGKIRVSYYLNDEYFFIYRGSSNLLVSKKEIDVIVDLLTSVKNSSTPEVKL